jgi:hypothetical protein
LGGPIGNPTDRFVQSRLEMADRAYASGDTALARMYLREATAARVHPMTSPREDWAAAEGKVFGEMYDSFRATLKGAIRYRSPEEQRQNLIALGDAVSLAPSRHVVNSHFAFAEGRAQEGREEAVRAKVAFLQQFLAWLGAGRTIKGVGAIARPPAGPAGVVMNAGLGDPEISKILPTVKPSPGLYDVVIHGRGGKLFVYSGETATEITHRSLTRFILKQPDYVPGTPIRLISCQAGQGAAQDLANKLGVTVRASTANVEVLPSGDVWAHGPVEDFTPGVR